jgi:hypothetical protein
LRHQTYASRLAFFAVVTDPHISLGGATGTGGVFRIGDTVTATWNATPAGDNTADAVGATVNFTQFGGPASVAATNAAGIWTATWTLAGSMDVTNRNVSVTVLDDAVNATTVADSRNATVDTIPPVVSDGRIAIGGATGTGGRSGSATRSRHPGTTRRAATTPQT